VAFCVGIIAVVKIITGEIGLVAKDVVVIETATPNSSYAVVIIILIIGVIISKINC
jgi:hypothetical protein